MESRFSSAGAGTSARAAASALLVLGLLLVAGRAVAAPVNPLAPLAVPRAQLGKIAEGLQVELLSGTTTNARAADDSFDPADTAASVTQAGRVSGFTLMYGDVGYTALRRGNGLLDVGTSLDIFKTVKQASAYQVESLRDLRRVIGANLQGVVVERATPFQVRGLGPNAVGLRIVQRVGTKRIHGTLVDFQIDKILCEAVIDRADPANVNAKAIAVAHTLAGRIAGYARGTLNPTAVPLPRPLGLRKPGAGAPDLSAMVLTAGDLKGKGGVFDQGFQPDDNAIASYVRVFRFGPSSGLFQLRATAALERSRREASGRLFVLRSLFTGPGGAAALAQSVGGTGGAKLDGARPAGVGEESFAAAATFTAQGTRYRAVVVYERRDRILASLILVGTPRKLTLDSAVAYARALDRRIESGLGSAVVA